MLQSVHQAGFTCYIVTVKPTRYAERIAESASLTPYFAKIYGSHLDGEFSLKADLIREVLKKENLDLGETVMVGDRASDIQGALRNGVPAIGVTYGYGNG
jgi:phosphoglycolate phosphatase